MSAAALRALHVPGTPLVLPNAWDAASARLVEAAGFPVVATSSAAVAESLGYTDHQGAPVEEMFEAFRRVTRAVSVPVSIDAEGGYGLSSSDLVARLADIGAVGINYEDTDHENGGLIDTNIQADRIAAVRAADPDLVINTRIDVFVGAEDQKAALDEGIERARAYLAAGADCVFPILLRPAELLKTFVDAVRPAPVNAVYLPGGPDLAAMAELGIARISMAAGLWRHTKAVLQADLKQIADGTMPY